MAYELGSSFSRDSSRGALSSVSREYEHGYGPRLTRVTSVQTNTDQQHKTNNGSDYNASNLTLSVQISRPGWYTTCSAASKVLDGACQVCFHAQTSVGCVMWAVRCTRLCRYFPSCCILKENDIHNIIQQRRSFMSYIIAEWPIPNPFETTSQKQVNIDLGGWNNIPMFRFTSCFNREFAQMT